MLYWLSLSSATPLPCFYDAKTALFGFAESSILKAEVSVFATSPLLNSYPELRTHYAQHDQHLRCLIDGVLGFWLY